MIKYCIEVKPLARDFLVKYNPFTTTRVAAQVALYQTLAQPKINRLYIDLNVYQYITGVYVLY